MIPNPAKSENNNKAGVTYFNKMLKKKYNSLFPLTISSDGFKIQPTIKHNNIVVEGIITVDVAKSNKSKTVLPNIVKFFIKPKDKQLGMTKAATIIETTTVAFSLDILSASLNDEIDASSILMEEVNAAKNNKIKNVTAKKLPINGNFSNT